MALVCKTLDAGTHQCVEWSEAVVLPPLTAEQGAELAGMIVPLLILAAALRIVRDLILREPKN